ncbi:MAG: hypothetical protein ABSB95_00850 [Dissulfurispiraceae bacterium]|jgi:hypothetical protein
MRTLRTRAEAGQGHLYKLKELSCYELNITMITTEVSESETSLVSEVAENGKVLFAA